MKWTNNTYAPGYRRLDWRLAYGFRMGHERGEVAFTVLGDGTPHAEQAAAVRVELQHTGTPIEVVARPWRELLAGAGQHAAARWTEPLRREAAP
jgi:hypothetical protein